MQCENLLDKKGSMRKENKMNDEELQTILADETTSAEEKQNAIKALVGTNFIPKDKYNEKISKGQEDYEALKGEYEAYKASKMTEEEKRADEAKKQAHRTQELSDTLSMYMVKNVFAENGLSEDDYKDELKNIIQSTPEATKVMAESVAKIISSQKAKIEESFKASLKQQIPKPEGGNTQTAMTDRDKLIQAYETSTNPVERASILMQINNLK